MWLILVDFRVFDGLLLDDDNEGPAVVFSGRWNTLLAYRNTLTKDKHYSCLQYHFCHLTCFALLVSSLVCTFTLFRNAISQVELHVVAPEWLQFAVVVEQHLHCGRLVRFGVRRIHGTEKEKYKFAEIIPRHNMRQF